MVIKKLGIFLSLAIATNTLLIPGKRASNTDPVAIVDAIIIRYENSENRLRSKATFNGVKEFSMILGFTIPSVTNDIEIYKNKVIPKPTSIALGIIFSGLSTSSPKVASLEYPVNAKNQILPLRIRFLNEKPFPKGMLNVKFVELVTDII
tara:strand:+ start:69 stop:518 length:450 start_codon:yes stop_codon:yes gene_type:complete